MKRIERWERARLRRIESYDKKIERAISENNQAKAEMLQIAKTAEKAHTATFWESKWRDLKRYAKEKNIDLKKVGVGSKRAFISIWMATTQDGKTKNPLRDIKYGLIYSTSRKPANSLKKAAIQWRQEAMEAEAKRKAKIEKLQNEGKEVPKELQTEIIIPPEAPKAREIQKMSTREFAEMYKDQLMDEYHALREGGMKGKEAKQWISNQWFASP